MDNELQKAKGGGIARDILKRYFHFQNPTKIVTKLEQFTKPGPFSTFQLFKLSQISYLFCRVLKMKISLAIPRPSPSGIHWPINSIKKKLFPDIKKKVFPESLLYISVLHFFCCWKYPETLFVLVKLIARNIKKKYKYIYIFSFSKFYKKLQQSWDNLKSWNVEKGPNFVSCPNFDTFFYISSYL